MVGSVLVRAPCPVVCFPPVVELAFPPVEATVGTAVFWPLGAWGDVAFLGGVPLVTLTSPGFVDVELFPGPDAWLVVPGRGAGELVDT